MCCGDITVSFLWDRLLPTTAGRLGQNPEKSMWEINFPVCLGQNGLFVPNDAALKST